MLAVARLLLLELSQQAQQDRQQLGWMQQLPGGGAHTNTWLCRQQVVQPGSSRETPAALGGLSTIGGAPTHSRVQLAAAICSHAQPCAVACNQDCSCVSRRGCSSLDWSPAAVCMAVQQAAGLGIAVCEPRCFGSCRNDSYRGSGVGVG